MRLFLDSDSFMVILYYEVAKKIKPPYSQVI